MCRSRLQVSRCASLGNLETAGATLVVLSASVGSAAWWHYLGSIASSCRCGRAVRNLRGMQHGMERMGEGALNDDAQAKKSPPMPLWIF